MDYVIFVEEGDGDSEDESLLYAAPLARAEEAYLHRVKKTLRPLSHEEYMEGPAVILQTAAKYSYILDRDTVLWCIEWAPGLIVVQFTPGGGLAWTAIRSPVPDFGGREATPAEVAAFDSEADNPQYNLIYDPWDAQFDVEDREAKEFVLASDDIATRYDDALAVVNDLAETMQDRYADEFELWSARCQENLAAWCGDGEKVE